MKKTPAEPPTAENLEGRFDNGEDVLDYFDAGKAKLVAPRNRASAQYLIELNTQESVVRESTASYAGIGSRKGTIKSRTQVKNPKTSAYAKPNDTPGSNKKGEFVDNKKGGKPFKGVAKEPDKRRK